MDDETRHCVTALMTPTAWGVECPCCGDVLDVERVEMDEAGAYHAAPECCVAECEICNVVVEIGAVRLVDQPGPPFRSGGGL